MFGLTMIRDYLNEILDGSKNPKTKKWNLLATNLHKYSDLIEIDKQ